MQPRKVEVERSCRSIYFWIRAGMKRATRFYNLSAVVPSSGTTLLPSSCSKTKLVDPHAGGSRSRSLQLTHVNQPISNHCSASVFCCIEASLMFTNVRREQHFTQSHGPEHDVNPTTLAILRHLGPWPKLPLTPSYYERTATQRDRP